MTKSKPSCSCLLCSEYPFGPLGLSGIARATLNAVNDAEQKAARTKAESAKLEKEAEEMVSSAAWQSLFKTIMERAQSDNSRHVINKLEYFADSLISPNAWEKWEVSYGDGLWTPCMHPPMWDELMTYRRKPTGYPHAALMALYAEDAMTSNTPWDNWECFTHGKWIALIGNPTWHVDNLYRRKENTNG